MKDYAKGRLDVSNDVGEKLDELAELSEREAHQCVGKITALQDAAAKVRLLHDHIDKDFEEGKLKGISGLDGVSTLKLYVTRASEALLNLAEKAKAEHLVANGKVAQARQSVEVVQRYARAAKVTLEQAYAAEAEAEKMKEPGAVREPRAGRASVKDRRVKTATKTKA